MIVVRETMRCKPGKVRPLVEKFQAMSKLMVKSGQKPFRIMTDIAAPRYWTLVAEFETEDLASFEKAMAPGSMAPEDEKAFGEIMKGYHDLVESGSREIYKLES